MRKHPILVIFFLAMSTCILPAQDSLFAFVDSKRSMRFAPAKINNYKYEIAKAIFDQLIEARGDLQRVPPKFVMNKGRQFVAWMHPGKKEIGLEEKAYDICTEFGPDSLNAIAALLAHEVIHYYEKHDWSRHFVNINQDLEASERIKGIKEALKFETQADYLGGILAISSGYNTYDVFDRFLKKAYTEYGLPEQIDGYPSLTERLQLSVNTADRLRKMHSVYQTANLLTLIGAHETANSYYRHLLTDYQGYEVYNNAGVNALLAAIALFEKEDLPFILPLELDVTSRLDKLATRLPRDVEEKREVLLNEAERWFLSATQLARKEPIAYLNTAAIFILREEWFDANYWANKALRLSQNLADSKQVADAQITLGIIEFLTGNKDKANGLFDQAMSGNPALAKVNKALLKPTPKAIKNLGDRVQGVEMIEGLFLDDFLASPEVETTAELSSTIFCGRKKMEESNLLLHYANDGDEYVLFHQTMPNYSGITKGGIGLGANKQQVLATYKTPSKIIELKTGSCWLFEENNILFIFDREDKLSSWVVFRKEI